MGRQGPCYHCGVASTPLWRHGPPEKPVLCNACGSRWRTKGSLENYTPLHSRYDSDNCEDHRVMRMKNISLKKTGEKLHKRKLNSAMAMESREFTSDYNHGYRKNADEDTSNRSSSGSAISNSESCARFGSADASDLTGPAQSMVWDAQIPSRKRTCISRPKLSSVEKLTRDLYTIMHEQASRFSGSSEEDLLFESEAPLVSVEIGHGSVLIRHPSSMAREDDSEASSLSQHKGAEDSTEQLISKSGPKSGFTSTLVSGKRFRECSNNLGPEAKCTLKSPRRVDYKKKGPIPNDASYFTPTPTNLLASLPTNGSSLMHDTVECEEEFSDQDILLDVPSNGLFPQAELLYPTYTYASQQASASSSSVHPSHFRR